MKYKKSFGLFKLMIVGVITILPVLALSESKKADVKNKQSEAKMILKQIYTMQKAYKVEKGLYWIPSGCASTVAPTSFAPIRIEIPYSARYTYCLTSSDAGQTNFTATATSGILDWDVYVDIWNINQGGTLLLVADDSEN